MREVNLTQGPILSRLVRFSLPMIAGNMLQQVYNLVDTLVVGRGIGANALAAVGSAYTLMTFLTSILIGLCMGSGAFFSEDYGAGDTAQLRQDMLLSFWFIFGVSVLIYGVIYPGMNPILRLLQTPEELMALMQEYVRAVFAGIFFVFLYNFFAYLLRSMGNSVVPLVFLAVSAVLNIVLDIWFVMGLSLGVAGAAWATVISQTVSGLGIAAYSFRRLPWLCRGRGGWDWGRFAHIVKNDVATGIQQSVMNFGILMIQGLVNSFGTVIMAAFAAAVKIDTLARNLIRLSGHKPDVDIKIVYSGLRPGEKLYEEKLMAEEGLRKTQNDLIHIGCPIPFDIEVFLGQLENLMETAYKNKDNIREVLKEVVSTYHPADQ